MSIMVWPFYFWLTLIKVAPARHITDQEWFQSQWWDKTLSWANIAFSTSCFWTACASVMSTVRGLGRGPPIHEYLFVLYFAVGQHHISITKTMMMKFRTLQHFVANWIGTIYSIKKWLPDVHWPVVVWALRPAAVAILRLATPVHEARIKRIARIQKSVPDESLAFPLQKFIVSFPLNFLRCL